MSAGIAGFIDGVFKGMDWREGRDDRKRRRTVEDERLGREREDYTWTREDREYTRAERARQTRERDRIERDAAAEREAFRGAFEASTAPSPDAQAPQVAGAGPTAQAEPQRTARRPDVGFVAPGANLTFGGAQQVQQPSSVSLPDGRAESVAGAREARSADPIYTYEAWRGMSRAERQRADLPVSEIGGQAYFDRLSVGFGAEPPRKAGRGAQERIEGEREALRREELASIVQNVPLPDSVQGPSAEAIRGQQRAPAEAQQNAFIGTEGPLRFGDAARGQEPVSTQEGAPAPSIEIATAPARRSVGITGPGMPVRATPGQRERGAGSFLANYAKNGAPKVVEHYMKTGQPEKAVAFQKFIDDQSTKAAMKHWSRAAHAAAIGDDDTFADAIADAYNSAGYYDDGVSVVRNETDFVKDDAGNVVGGKITFRNEETGETFTQELRGYAEIVQLGLGLLAPETVFEEGWKRVEAARSAQAAAQAEGAKRAAKGADPQVVATIFKELSAANLTSPEPKSTEELWSMAAQMAANPQGAFAGGGDIPFLP